MAPGPRCAVLNVGVSPVDIPAAVAAVLASVRDRRPGYVCATGVHGVMESWRDPALARVHNEAFLVVPDGMPLVWMCRAYGHRQVGRVYGPDLMLEVCRAGQAAGLRHFLFGGNDGVAELLAEKLRARFPQIQIVGTFCPPFRAATAVEDEEIVRTINATGADVVWVGLSTPKQELWMHAHRDRLSAPILAGVGAAFDFHAGLKPQAPSWMQRAGLEWLFRLGTEPRRLWRRYLVNNPLFVGLAFLQLSRARRFKTEGLEADR